MSTPIRLCSIHGVIRDFTFPLVYVLATRKDEHLYRSILNRLKAHAIEIHKELKPQFISSDFEVSFLNAARDTFPDATLHECLFHFNQSLWRYVVNRGLIVPFTDRINFPEVRKAIQCLMALPYIPVDDVFETFDLIVNGCALTENDEHFQQLHDFFLYVQRIYVRGVTARGRREQYLHGFLHICGMYMSVDESPEKSKLSIMRWLSTGNSGQQIQ